MHGRKHSHLLSCLRTAHSLFHGLRPPVLSSSLPLPDKYNCNLAFYSHKHGHAHPVHVIVAVKQCGKQDFPSSYSPLVFPGSSFSPGAWSIQSSYNSLIVLPIVPCPSCPTQLHPQSPNCLVPLVLLSSCTPCHAAQTTCLPLMVLVVPPLAPILACPSPPVLPSSSGCHPGPPAPFLSPRYEMVMVTMATICPTMITTDG